MPSPPSTLDELFALIQKSKLIDPSRLDAYRASYDAASTPPGSVMALATAMVRDGLLTKYQSKQLLSGRWRNFFIGNKYKVLERLGSGGMATVFLCEHKTMQRCVAIKVLPPDLADDADALARFYREARAVAQLRHPNIAGAYDIDHVGKMHFLVMEYVDGKDLGQLMAHRGPMAPEVAAHYIAQAALGLQHAHEAGLVHRDIKPANLMVERSGTVKVLDLGLARFFHEEETDGLTKSLDLELVLGTLDYISPEQALDSHEVDIRADIYSLGATFYFLLTGQGLFPGATAAQKLSRHQFSKPKAIRKLRPEVPEELAAVVERMLAKSPADRFQEPIEVVEALAPWTQEPIPPPSMEGMPGLSPAAQKAGRSGGVASARTPRPQAAASSLHSNPSSHRKSSDGTPAASSSSSSRPTLASTRTRSRVLTAAVAALVVILVVGAWWSLNGSSRIDALGSVPPKASAPRPKHGGPGIVKRRPRASPGRDRSMRPPPEDEISSLYVSTPVSGVGLVVSKPDPEIDQRVGPLKAEGPGVVVPPASSPQAGPWRVSTLTPDGRSRRVIQSSKREVRSPTWSADGKSLILQSEGQFWALPVSGGQLRRIPIDPTPGVFDGQVEPDHGVSPDGKLLAFTAGSLYVVPPTGGSPRRVNNRPGSYFHGWSPDSKFILFVALHEQGDFKDFQSFSIPVGGGPETCLTRRRACDEGPEFSPDGKWVYFSSTRAGNRDIWRIPIEGRSPDDDKAQRVTADDSDDWYPHPSPDGQWLLFLSHPRGVSDYFNPHEVTLRLMPLPRGQTVEVGAGLRVVETFVGGNWSLNDPPWSPDGSRIAYITFDPKFPQPPAGSP